MNVNDCLSTSMKIYVFYHESPCTYIDIHGFSWSNSAGKAPNFRKHFIFEHIGKSVPGELGEIFADPHLLYLSRNDFSLSCSLLIVSRHFVSSCLSNVTSFRSDSTSELLPGAWPLLSAFTCVEPGLSNPFSGKKM